MAIPKKEEALLRRAAKYALVVRQDRLVVRKERTQIRFHDYDIALEMMDIHRMMEKVIPSKAALFKWREHPKKSLPGTRWADGSIQPTSFGKDVLKHLHMNIDARQYEFPLHDFHPMIVLFGKYAPKMNVFAETPTRDACDRLNRLVDEMRTDGRTDRFRNERDRWLSRVRERNKNLQAAIQTVYRRRSGATAVLINLSYRIDEPASPIAPDEHLGMLVSQDQARKHRDELVTYLQRKFEVPLFTYAWKEEYGRMTSHRFNLLLLFDAGPSLDPTYLGNQVGCLWKNITKGIGRFHNCVYDEDVNLGLGHIRSHNVAKLKVLNEVVAPILTKSDFFWHLNTPGRNYSKGGVPHKQPRPRKRDSGHYSPNKLGAWEL